MSEFRQKRLHTLYMDRGVLATGTMADINGKLEHRKAVFLQTFPEIRVGPFVFLRFGRQVKQYQYPHNTIFADALYHRSG